MKKWTNSGDIMNEIQNAYDRLCTGKSTVEEARAKANLLKAATKHVEIMLEHAKATGRLEQGSDAMPGFSFSDKPSVRPAVPSNGHPKRAQRLSA